MVPEEDIGYTDTQRTRESARHFARGFLNRTEIILPPPVQNQQLLNYWVVCERFKKNIQQKINTPLSPKRKFIKLHTLPAVRDLVNNINTKLGYRNRDDQRKKGNQHFTFCFLIWKFPSLSRELL